MAASVAGEFMRPPGSEAVLLRRDLTIEIGESPTQRVGLASQRTGVGEFGTVVRGRRPRRISVDDLQLGDELRTPLPQRGEIRSVSTKYAHAAIDPSGPVPSPAPSHPVAVFGAEARSDERPFRHAPQGATRV